MIRSLQFLIVALAALSASITSQAATRYVNNAASGANNGTSWANAYTRLQDALAVATSGDQIWVASGTYKPSTTGNRTQSFNVSSGVGLYGSFAGTESTLAERSSTAAATILSGDLLGNDNGSRTRSEATRLDNTYNVVRVTGAASTVTFDRVTIQSGHSETYEDSYDRGAGIHFLASTAGNVVITNCIIRWNTARIGAALNDDSGHAFKVISTHLIENQTERAGAAGFGASFTIQNSTFVGNRTEDSRDGYNWGGGLFIGWTGAGQVINCIFASNYAAESGGAIFNDHGNIDVINCTFYGNSAGASGQTINNYYSPNFRISNSIIWSSSGGGSVIGNENANTEVRNSLVQGGYSGSGTVNVISSDPQFINSSRPLGADGLLGTADDGLRLGFGSPAINTGNNSYLPAGVTTDIASLKRIKDTVDLGCYEFSPLNVSTLPSTGAPSARYWHTAVWTGTEMIIWGGENGSTTLGDGARYNPTTRQWTAVNPSGAPSARTDHTAVWTGTEMIIFGGWNKSSYFNDGARYNPSTNSWTQLPTVNAPIVRNQHSAVWAGGKMIVFGGSYGFPNYPNGAIWDSSTNVWSALSTTNAPANRSFPGGVWTGTEMFIWGGDNGYYRMAQGGLFNPSTNTWRLVSTTGQPNPTGESAKGMAVGSSVWTGSKMIVFGGVYGETNANNPGGGIFDPTSNSWTNLPSITTGVARRHHASVWAFDKMFVFGGVDGSASGNLISDNAVYDINKNQWLAGPSSPTPNLGWALQTALWTGESILVWGGITQLGTDSHSATASGYSVSYDKPPTLTNPGNQTIFENTATNLLSFTVADQESSPSSLVVTASSSNTTLVPNANIVLGGSGANRTVRVTPAVGQSGSATITINVSNGVSNGLESFQLTVTSSKPLFSLNPNAGTAINPNNSITFTANYLAGIAPFTYRWRKNGTFIGGANANSYTIASAKQSDEASYDCVITNGYGSFTTSATVLTVNDPVVIVTPPLAQAANAGQQVTLTVNVTGTEPISFQWRKNGVPLSDQNAPQLVLEVDANSTGFYDVVVTNPLGSVSTLPALLTALVPPVITSQPSSQDVSVGSTAFFTVTAEGPSLTYQWRRNGSNLSGQTGFMLMLSNVQKANEGVYDVLVKNSFGAVLSDPVWLTLPQPLSITEQPQDVTAAPGDTASFSVTASGPGLLTYQWNKDGKPIKDAKSSTLTVPVNDAVTAAGAYTVTVSSGSLKVTSTTAYLRVPEEGLLIYKFTVTGSYFVGTRSSVTAQSGLLILDRLNQRGGIIRYGKNGKLDTFSTEIKDGLRTHSTGPMTNSQTVVSQVVQEGGAPNEEVAVLWLRGMDGAVLFSASDKTMAPKTLAGFQTELNLTEGTEVASLSVIAILDNAASLQARQAGETVEQTLNRLSAGLQQKGFIRE